MACEVCGTVLHRAGDDRCCTTCDAVYVQRPDGALVRRPFPPGDRRWAAASGADGVEHAVTYAGTLCGTERDAVTVMRHHWSSRRPGACAECRTVADERLTRWPAETGR